MSIALTLAVLAVGLLLTPLFCRWWGRNAGWALAVVYVGAAVAYLPAFLAGAPDPVAPGSGPPAPGTTPAQWAIPWIPALNGGGANGGIDGIQLAFSADPTSSVFTLIALLIGAVVLVYSTRYLEPGPNLSFYLGMALFTLSMVGLVTADDLVVLFICWELTSLASFLLIARSGQGAVAPSMRTLLITFLGGLALLVAVVLTAVRAGTTHLGTILASDVWTQDPALTTTVGLLIALAAMTKSAQFPFHSWLPDAMAAATPVSAYLHAAAVVKAGIFLLLRFSPVFHADVTWSVLLVSAGLVTSAVGGWRALQQHDLKKLMAYSTVSQLGLIVAAIGTGTSAGIAAAFIHTIAHALFKSGLFMVVGVVDHATGTRDLRRMPVLHRALPFTFTVTILGAGAMAGIPPLLGFISKESIFTALNGWAADGGASGVLADWAGPVALAGAAIGSVLTFAYCGKIVVGAFLDPERADHHGPAPSQHHAHPHTHDAGPAGPDVHAPGAVLVSTAAVPILASVAALFVLPLVDTAVGSATNTALPGAQAHPHFVLWHGVTPELLTTLAVFALGLLTVAVRHRLWPALERRTLPVNGAAIIEACTRGLAVAGDRFARLTSRDAAATHAATMVAALAAVVVPGVLVLDFRGELPPLRGDLNQPVDVVLLLLFATAAAGVALSRSRLGATVALSAVGILMTAQILALGAPDVALTQLLVESLTIIVIMLVLQRLPRTFSRPRRARAVPAAVIAIAAGLATGLAAWGLTGRREKAEVGQYLLDNGQDITGGFNIVNVILVEFRALDTLGELSVLGMAGIALAAVLSTVRTRYMDPTVDRLTLHEEDGADRPGGPDLGSETARRAILSSWGNIGQLQLMLKVILPLLAVVSAVLFWRGHNEPGGGFIAALVGSAIVGLLYLSTARDRQIGPPRAPIYLIGGGVVLATGIGLWNMAATGTYMEPQHGYVLGQHLTTALVFDAGVYLAVLGLILLAFNVLGTARSAGQFVPTPGAPAGRGQVVGEASRERVDETVLGEIDGPRDNPIDLMLVASDRPTPSQRPGQPVRPGTQHIASGEQPDEWGR